jgi:zinc protease
MPSPASDYTAYFQRRAGLHCPNDEAGSGPHAQSGLNDDEFAAEIKVVMEERRLRTDDNPQAQVYET